VLRAAKQEEASKAVATPPKTAREAVEQGLVAFKERKDYAGAVKLYQMAMKANPDDDEARAALYNMGCAYAKLKQWREATDCVVSAINDYNLKLTVALRVSNDHFVCKIRNPREAV